MTPSIFGLSGHALTADERAFFRESDPAGYILFGRNVESREQLRRLTDDLREIHGRERLLVSIDQEGGRVARMKPPEWAGFPPGEASARLRKGSRSVSSSASLAATVGSSLWLSAQARPCPGMCLTHPVTPARASPSSTARPSAATCIGSQPRARSPITSCVPGCRTSSSGR